MGRMGVGELSVRALRAVLVVMLVGTVFVQVGMVWALAGASEWVEMTRGSVVCALVEPRMRQLIKRSGLATVS